PINGRPRPEADRIGAQLAGDADGMTEKIRAILPFFRRRADQRRLVLSPRIEQKTGPCLHDAAQPVFFEQPPYRLDATRQLRLERIQDVKIQRERHAAVAELRQDRQRILEAVMGEAVGVVAEEQCLPLYRDDRGALTSPVIVLLSSECCEGFSLARPLLPGL